MPRPEVWVLLFFLALINVAMVVGRVWGVDIGVVLGTVPIVLGIGALAVHDLVRWHRHRPKPLPRAIVMRP